MVSQLLETDKTVFYIINHLPHTSFTDGFSLYIHGLTYAGILFAVLFFYNCFSKNEQKKELGKNSIVALVVATILTEGVIKQLVQRLRPYDGLHAVIDVLPNPGGYSFPSMQSAIAWAAATVYLIMGAGKKGKIFFTALAVLTSLNRVYMGHHYPSDVLAGGFIGILTSVCVIYVLRKKTLYCQELKRK